MSDITEGKGEGISKERKWSHVPNTLQDEVGLNLINDETCFRGSVAVMKNAWYATVSKAEATISTLWELTV